ncbi:MAG: hypothetical protein AB1649_05755 [Chloroflexota bacterium]
MDIFQFINGLLNIANNALDVFFLWGGLILLFGYPLYFFFKNVISFVHARRKNRRALFSADIFTQTIILFLICSVLSGIWALPEILAFFWPPAAVLPETWFRWVLLMLGMVGLAHMFGHEHGQGRWLQSSLGHIAAIAFGLLIGRWAGLFFITLPALTAYYFMLYNMAVVTLPASDPEDRLEKRKRFIILAAYAWGIQLPILVADGNAWKKPEVRIPGDFTWDYPVPGLIWTRSHQAAAITGGTKFKRVDGPGVVFTGKLERPEQIFDLRAQIRVSEIDAFSKDGIKFKARVTAAFRLDPTEWDKDTYNKLRPMNSVLRGADKPDHTVGSFPYSSLRVQAALRITSTQEVANSTVYWDQWALSVVEDQARKVLSQKDLAELWRPTDDKLGANALERISTELVENVRSILQSAGILVLAARVVNFRFSEDSTTDDFSQQQIATWGAEWEKKRSNVLAEAKAQAERKQQEARAYAHSLLLNSIAEALKKTHEVDSRIPRYVIAMRFLSALQDYIHKYQADGEEGEDDIKRAAELHNYLKEWQTQFFLPRGKEPTK